MNEPEPARAEAWPFLVTRGRNVGRRVVLAPPFLLSTNRHTGLISEVVKEADQVPGLEHFWARHVSDEDGSYWLVFRTITADPDHVAEPGPPLQDAEGHPITLSEGVVVRGPQLPADPLELASLLDAAHTVAAQAFRWFWQADDATAAPFPAPPLLRDRPAVLQPPTGKIRPVSDDRPLVVLAPVKVG